MMFQVPFEYGGMGGIIGLKYEALKDFCKWYGYKPLSKYVPLFNNLGKRYASLTSQKV